MYMPIITPLSLFFDFDHQSGSTSDELFTVWDLYSGISGNIVVVALAFPLLLALSCIVFVASNDKLEVKEKKLWIFGLLFLNIMILPGFWYRFIWKAKAPSL